VATMALISEFKMCIIGTKHSTLLVKVKMCRTTSQQFPKWWGCSYNTWIWKSLSSVWCSTCIHWNHNKLICTKRPGQP